MTRPIKEGRTGLCTKINQNLCSYAPGFYHFFYTRTFVLVLQLWNWFIQASDTLSRHFQGCRAAWHSSNFYSISCIESAAPKQPAIDCSRHWEAQKISTLPSPFHWISGPMSGLGFMWPQYLVSSHVQSKSMCDHQFHRPFALLGKKLPASCAESGCTNSIFARNGIWQHLKQKWLKYKLCTSRHFRKADSVHLHRTA